MISGSSFRCMAKFIAVQATMTGVFFVRVCFARCMAYANATLGRFAKSRSVGEETRLRPLRRLRSIQSHALRNGAL